MNKVSAADAENYRKAVMRSLLSAGRKNQMVIIGSVLMTYVICQSAAPVYGLPWLIISVLVTLLRFLLHDQILSRLEKLPIIRLRMVFYVSMLLGGAIWGAASIIFFSSDNLLITSSLVLMLLGVTAAGAFSYSLDNNAVICYALPSLLPLASQFAFHSPQYGFFYIIMCLMFGLGLVNSAKGNQKFFSNNYQTGKLSEQLTHTALEASSRLQAYLDNTPLGFVEWNDDNQVINWNPAATTILGYSRDEAMGMSTRDFKVEFEPGSAQSDSIKLWQHGESATATVRMARADGEFIYCKWSNAPLRNPQGKVLAVASFVEDVTERVLAQQTIQLQLHTDNLTGLPNRNAFTSSLARNLRDMAAKHQHAAVMLLDLDNFKDINDTRGHHYGDEILVEFGRRLRRLISEKYEVARFGGDEFVILMPNLPSVEEHARLTTIGVAESILAMCDASYLILEEEFYIQASMGVVVFADPLWTENDILQRADLALYEVKKGGRNDYCFHEPAMTHIAQQQMQLIQDLRDAVRKRELVPFYHPIFEVANHRVIGAEVLLRWCKGTGEIISAAEFIHILETSPMNREIVERTMEEVCGSLKHWQESQLWLSNMMIYFNLSPQDIRHRNFVQMFVDSCHRHDVAPSSFEFELTERSLFQQSERVQDQIRLLSDLGARIAIDDFGTGYSSLSYIKHLPIDTIKIDRMFISDFLTNENDLQLTRAIIYISNALSLNCVAEGVETVEQLQKLKELGCPYYQGFYGARPMTRDAFEQFLYSQDVTHG